MRQRAAKSRRIRTARTDSSMHRELLVSRVVHGSASDVICLGKSANQVLSEVLSDPPTVLSGPRMCCQFVRHQPHFPGRLSPLEQVDHAAHLALGGLGQVLARVELITKDDTSRCDLILARKRVMGAAASFEHAQCAFELGVTAKELEQDHVVG
jgi:hypothetical protein